MPVLVGLVAAALAQPALASAQDAADPTPTPSACLLPDTAAAVGTDKPIYSNFETVTLSGSGYAADCALKLEVEDPAQAVASYDVTTGANGAFTATHELGSVDGTYLVRVRDAASNEVLATAEFIDGVEVKELHKGAVGNPTRIFEAGDTVVAEGLLDADKIYRWVVRKPNGEVATSTPCSTVDTPTAKFRVEHSFTLPAGTPVTGKDAWTFELRQYGWTDNWFSPDIPATVNCANDKNFATDQIKFRVATAVTSADKPGAQTKYWFKPGERAWVSLRGLSPDSDWQVRWYKPDGTLSCDNLNGYLFSNGQPDVPDTGVLESLVYAPLDSGDQPYNRHDAYSKTAAGRCSSATAEGEWSVQVDGEEWNPHVRWALFPDDVSKRFKAFGIDGTPPVVTKVTAVPAWSTTPVTIEIEATDARSGVKSIEYRKNGTGAWTAYTAGNKPTLGHGEKLSYRVTDVAGNVTEDETGTAQVDGQAPTTTASGFAAGWQKDGQTITLTATDNGPSGVAKIEYRKVGTTDWTTYDAAAKPVLAHGETLEFFATDVAKNKEAVKQVGPAQVDGDAPTTVASGFTSGWQKDTQTITLTATDNGPSGVAKVEFRKADTTDWTTYDAAAKPVLAHGESLEFRATDAAGNVETVKSVGPAQVDGTTPTTSSDFAGGWHKAPVAVTLTVDGNGPAPDTIQWRKDAADAWETYDAAAKPTLAHGEKLQFRGIDAAGNEETAHEVGPAQVDGDAPTTVASGFAAGWQKDAQTIELTATDAGPSGLDKIEWRKAAGDAWTTYDAAAKPVLADGESLEFFATDVAGNAEAVKQVGPAQVDTDAPVTTATFSTDWSNGPVPVTLAATDADSGVERIEYRKPGGTWATYDDAAQPTLADGESFEFRAVDTVGNEEATKSTDNAKVDTDKPATTATLASGWHTTAVPVRLVATDAKSGVAKIEVRVAGTATWSTYDDAARPTLTHGQALEYRATDKVGNTEDTKVTAAAQVDGQAPTTTDDVPTGEVDGPTAVTLTATDAGPSGLGKVEWRKPGGTTWTVYAGNARPVLANGERLEYRATDVAGNAEVVKQSAALKVKVAPPVTGTDSNQNAPVVSASSASRTAALPTITNLAIAPACMVGLSLDAPTAGRKAVSLSYVLGGGATQVEITIQKRDPSAARKTCAATNNVRKPGAKYETVDQQKVAGKDGAASNDIGSHDEAATARAARAKAAKTVKKIVARRAAVAGRNSVTLAKLASGKQLAAGTYRVLVVAIDASGRRSAPAKAVFRVVSGS